MLTVIVIILYICVVLFDFLPSKKALSKNGSVVYCAILFISFSVLFLYSVGIKVPGPSEALKNAVEVFIKPSK